MQIDFIMHEISLMKTPFGCEIQVLSLLKTMIFYLLLLVSYRWYQCPLY